MDPFRSSFSSVSTPIFTSKGAFFSIFQALHFFLCTIPDFCDFSSLRTTFCKICRFFADFQRRQQILQIFTEFQRNFAGISQNFNNFAKSDAKIATFQRNLRKIAEKLLQISPLHSNGPTFSRFLYRSFVRCAGEKKKKRKKEEKERKRKKED